MEIDSPVLENEVVKLSPLSLENYKNLYEIAFQPKLVQYSPSDVATEKALKNYVETALKSKALQEAIPFIVYSKKHDLYAGCTRYMNIDRPNKVLHIGATWLGREFHGTGLNTHMKVLMLNYAFDILKFEKVEFRIDERNIRSRKAVGKLGAVLEGTLRKNVYLLDGFKRNTCCYGILSEEWNDTKKNLLRSS
jgi:RimJ/RimL family protein N-acetyltransferase